MTVAHSPMKREFCFSVYKTLFESHRKGERMKTETVLLLRSRRSNELFATNRRQPFHF
jgi:hypothetical protein